MGHRSCTGRLEKAQATLELALTLPIFLTLLLGVFEIARLFFYNVSVANASREAARYAATSGCPSSTACASSDLHYYQDCSGIRNRAVTKSPGIGLKTTNVVISYDSGHGTSALYSDCSSSVALATGNRVKITVTKPFSLIVPIPGLKSFNIISTTYRTYLGQVQ